jgi:hypothetical protein
MYGTYYGINCSINGCHRFHWDMASAVQLRVRTKRRAGAGEEAGRAGVRVGTLGAPRERGTRASLQIPQTITDQLGLPASASASVPAPSDPN